MGMGACDIPMKKEAPEACTRMSAPTPSTRLALSFTMPWQRPTTRMTMATSMATASTLTTVRTGRCRILAMISLFTNGVLSLLGRAQIDQFRSLRLLQFEFFRPEWAG